MNERSGAILLCLGLIGSVLAGCDSVEGIGNEPPTTSDSFDSAELLVGLWPPAQRGAMDLATDSALTIAVPAPAANQNPFPPMNLEPTEELMIDWLRWASAQPLAEGPIADQTGERCGLGQDGPVWFLAGTFGGPVVRECSIPAGKQLFFPLVNRWCLFPPEYYADQAAVEADLPICEAWFDRQSEATCSLTLRVDGQEVRPDFETLDEELYIRVMEPFEVYVDEDWGNEHYAGGSSMPLVGDGHYARLQPLTPGDHVVELGGSVCGDYPFSTSATYFLHVG